MSADRTDKAVTEHPNPAGPEDLWAALARAIAYLRVLSLEEVITEATANGGDVVIDSKDAVVIIPIAEEEFGGARLVEVSDLKRRELTSLRNLSKLMWTRWSERQGGDDS